MVFDLCVSSDQKPVVRRRHEVSYWTFHLQILVITVFGYFWLLQSPARMWFSSQHLVVRLPSPSGDGGISEGGFKGSAMKVREASGPWMLVSVLL